VKIWERESRGVLGKEANLSKGRNCQSWIFDYIAWLVGKGLTDKAALESLENADKV